MGSTTTDISKWYFDGLEDYQARFRPAYYTTAGFFKQHQTELGFNKMKEVLSIGPGDGEFDTEILEVFTGCSHYIGVEPSQDAVISLGQKLTEKYPNIKRTLVEERVEDWRGPPDKVDMVLAAQVMYTIQEPRYLMLETFISWLKPGGLLVIFLNQEAITCKIRQKMKNFSRANINSYDQAKLKEDLQHVEANIIYEQAYKFDLDARNPTKALADFCQFSDCTDEEVEEVHSVLSEFTVDGVVNETICVTIVRKD